MSAGIGNGDQVYSGQKKVLISDTTNHSILNQVLEERRIDILEHGIRYKKQESQTRGTVDGVERHLR